MHYQAQLWFGAEAATATYLSFELSNCIWLDKLDNSSSFDPAPPPRETAVNCACFSGGEGRANARVSLPTFPAASYCLFASFIEVFGFFAPVVAGAVSLGLASCFYCLLSFGRQKIGVLLAKRCFLSSEAAGGVGGVSL